MKRRTERTDARTAAWTHLLRGIAAACALTLGLSSVAYAQSVDDRLERVRRDQDRALSQLDNSKQALAASRQELAALQARLADARAQLSLVRGQVALAQDGYSSAVERVEAATETADAAKALLADASEQLAEERQRLDGRLVAMHMYGPAAQGELAFALTVGSSDPVELSRNLYKLEAVAAYQSRVVEDVADLQAKQKRFTVEAERAQRVAASEQIDAEGALELVQALEVQAATLAELVESEESSQRRLVAELADTVAGQQALLAELDQEREALEEAARAARFSSTGLVCPIAGVRFINDWGFPRSGGRTHKGNDLFADAGTPIIAIADGVIRNVDSVDNHRGSGTGDLGGISVSYWVSDTEYWYFSHMQGIAAGISEGDAITQGQLLGWVGNTGNARTTPPHAHVQRKTDGVVVNPYNLLKAACG